MWASPVCCGLLDTLSDAQCPESFLQGLSQYLVLLGFSSTRKYGLWPRIEQKPLGPPHSEWQARRCTCTVHLVAGLGPSAFEVIKALDRLSLLVFKLSKSLQLDIFTSSLKDYWLNAMSKYLVSLGLRKKLQPLKKKTPFERNRRAGGLIIGFLKCLSVLRMLRSPRQRQRLWAREVAVVCF